MNDARCELASSPNHALGQHLAEPLCKSNHRSDSLAQRHDFHLEPATGSEASRAKLKLFRRTFPY